MPCTNGSGEAGLYDMVNGDFYGNEGSGSFSAGPEVEEPEEPGEELDPYTWYESDIPVESDMAAYLANVQAVWDTLLEAGDAALPETMAGLTAAGANRIEEALLTVLDFLERMAIDLFYCGEVYCGEV